MANLISARTSVKHQQKKTPSSNSSTILLSLYSSFISSKYTVIYNYVHHSLPDLSQICPSLICPSSLSPLPFILFHMVAARIPLTTRTSSTCCGPTASARRFCPFQACINSGVLQNCGPANTVGPCKSQIRDSY